MLKDALIKGKGRVLVVGSTRLKVYPRLQVYLDDPEFTTRSFSPTRAFYQAKLAQLQFALAFERYWAGTGVIAKALSVPALGVDAAPPHGVPREDDRPPAVRFAEDGRDLRHDTGWGEDGLLDALGDDRRRAEERGRG